MASGQLLGLSFRIFIVIAQAEVAVLGHLDFGGDDCGNGIQVNMIYCVDVDMNSRHFLRSSR